MSDSSHGSELGDWMDWDQWFTEAEILAQGFRMRLDMPQVMRRSGEMVYCLHFYRLGNKSWKDYIQDPMTGWWSKEKGDWIEDHNGWWTKRGTIWIQNMRFEWFQIKVK